MVTGAGRGIGRAVAGLLAAHGARLVICDSGGDAEGAGIDPSVIESAARELRASGADVVADCRDLTQPGASESLVERAIAALGPLDGVVTSAGSLVDAPALRTEPAALERALAIGVLHPLAMLRAAAPKMIERKSGALVALAGSGAFFGLRGRTAESAAHGALVAAIRPMALELRKHDVRVNAVVGGARTRLTEHLPLYRSIEPASLSADHVAAAVAFLLTSEAADITGEVIGVAGPRTYAFRIRETPGAFGDGNAPADLATAGARIRDGLRS